MIPWLHRASGGFVQNHVPDSDLVPLRLVVAAGERAGFEVRDVESLREHYQKTLSFWLSNLERRFEDAERRRP